MDEQEIQQLHRPIDESIVQAMLSVIPEGWWSICLDICREDSTASENGLSLSITSDEGHQEVVIPPEELYALVLSHREVFDELGKPWRKLHYRVAFDESINNWRFTIDYDYF